LETIRHVRESGISVCSGGIIGLGEASTDRVGLLHTLATSLSKKKVQTSSNQIEDDISPHPESLPVNALVAVKGTPLENNKVRFIQKEKKKN